MNTTTTAAEAFKDLVVTAAQEMQRINPNLTADEAIARAAAYVAHKMATERPSLAVKVAATL